MDLTENEITPLNEQKSFDETTLFGITEDGSVSRRRRRKSAGRRVSFAEATSLHIFQRDDDYETPTRGNDGSSHNVGQRRSPRLASKRHPIDSDDKENRPLNFTPTSRVKRKGKKLLAISDEVVDSPALTPQNWLDSRDSSSLARNDEENTGPVDLRHISFDRRENDMPEENVTLDSTTFALKFSQKPNQNFVPALNPSVRNESSAMDIFNNTTPGSVSDGKHELDATGVDMSFTMIRPVLRPIHAVDVQTGTRDCSDMSITVQVPRELRRRSQFTLTEPSRQDEVQGTLEDQMTVLGDVDDNSISSVKQNVQITDEKLQPSSNVPVDIEEEGSTEPNKGLIISSTSRQTLEATETVDVSVSSLSAFSLGCGERSITMGIPGLLNLVEKDAVTGMTDLALPEMQTEREPRSPIEDAQLISSDGEHSMSMDITESGDVVGAEGMDAGMEMVLTGMQTERESHSPTKDAEKETTEVTYGRVQHSPPARAPEEVQAMKKSKSLAETFSGSSSPDSSMEILVDKDYSALHFSKESGNITSSPDSESSQVAVSFAGREIKDHTQVRNHNQESDNAEAIFSGEKIDRSHVLNASQKNKSEQDPLVMLRHNLQSQPIRIRDDYFHDHDGVSTAESMEPTHILSNSQGKDYTHILGTREAIDPTRLLNVAQEKGNDERTHAGLKQNLTSGLIKSHKKDSEQEMFVSEELLEPTHILSFSQANLNEQGPLIEKDQDQDPVTMERMHLAPTLVTAQQNEQNPSTLMRPGQKVPSPLTGSQEGHREQSTLAEMENEFSHTLHAVNQQEFDRVNQKRGFFTQVGSGRTQIEPALMKTTHGGLGEPMGGQENVNVRKMSVKEFLQIAEVQFSLNHESPREVLKDPALAAHYEVHSLSECLYFKCLVQPKSLVMRDACEELYEVLDIKSTAVAELEKQLTASNPAIFAYFQKAGESEKQRMRKQFKEVQDSCRLIERKDLLQFQQSVEEASKRDLLHAKNQMLEYLKTVKEERNSFDDTFRGPFVRLQARLSLKAERIKCTSKEAPNKSNVGVNLRKEASLDRIEDLKERIRNLKSSNELKSVKLRTKMQENDYNLRCLKQHLELSQRRVLNLRNQVVDILCMGQSNPDKKEIACRPDFFATQMRSTVKLLHNLQDGFQVQFAGNRNMDPVVELCYRSLLKRRYVVHKAGNVVDVVTSSWVLESEKIDKMFRTVNASEAFRFALITTAKSGTSERANLRASTQNQKLHRVFTTEAVRFTLAAIAVGIPDPTELRSSMQATRILVGNLMELMDEVMKCQRVVNKTCNGGVLAEPRFRRESDGRLNFVLDCIDCILSAKFSITLDMSCLQSLHFTKEALESALSAVEPGCYILERSCIAVGILISSVRNHLPSRTLTRPSHTLTHQYNLP